MEFRKFVLSNGEIYNFNKLKKYFNRKGYKFNHCRIRSYIGIGLSKLEV